jgi:hypothetical protein
MGILMRPENLTFGWLRINREYLQRSHVLLQDQFILRRALASFGAVSKTTWGRKRLEAFRHLNMGIMG